MTTDQFEHLARLMKGLNEHFDERFLAFRSDIATEFHDVRQHIDNIASTQALLLREIENLKGFVPEIRNHGDRLPIIEAKLGITPKAIRY